jgi:3',5'-cyclic AMP phosphodiesterase CpdA
LRTGGRCAIRVLVHLSDIHFGRIAPGVVEPIIEAAWNIRPNMTIVSGDFVQNGTRDEFRAAHNFLHQLPEPRLTVPGNHDLPFRNIIRRFRIGLDFYREYISPDPEPFYMDDEVAILGINTARALHFRGGRIAEQQIKDVEQRLCSLEADVFKILVTHHPFDLPPRFAGSELVGKARLAMGRIAQSVDLLLAGHMHISYAASTASRYRLKGRSAVFVQAGTATSTRGRGEPNAFNVIKIDPPRLLIERHQWNADRKRFACVCTDRFTIEREAPVCATQEIKAASPEEVEVLHPAG